MYTDTNPIYTDTFPIFIGALSQLFEGGILTPILLMVKLRLLVTRCLLPGHTGIMSWDSLLDSDLGLPVFILSHQRDSVFLPVKWVSYTDLDHLPGG